MKFPANFRDVSLCDIQQAGDLPYGTCECMKNVKIPDRRNVEDIFISIEFRGEMFVHETIRESIL